MSQDNDLLIAQLDDPTATRVLTTFARLQREHRELVTDADA